MPQPPSSPRLHASAAAFLCLLTACSGAASSPQRQRPNAPERPRPTAYQRSDCVRGGMLHRDGSMWFATTNEGVFRYADGVFTQFTKRDGLPSNFVTALTQAPSGDVWLGTDRGLCCYDGAGFTPVPIPWDGNEDLWGKGLNANLVQCLHCDADGNIWFGTWGNGAHRFDPSRPVAPGRYSFSSYLQDRGSTYDNNSHRNVVQSITEDEHGVIWLTSMSHGGVSRFDGETFTHYDRSHGLSDDMVFSSLVDRRGDLWLGMLGNRPNGLIHFDGTSFQQYGTPQGLSSDNIVNIVEDRAGTLWLASARGKLCLLSRDDQAGVRIAPFQVGEQTFEHMFFVAEDRDGGVWFGGDYGRLYRYDGTALVDHTSKS